MIICFKLQADLLSTPKTQKVPWDGVTLSQQEAEQLEKDTRQQSGCPQWFKAREVRITASNFGKFILRKAPISDKFLKNTLHPSKFTSSATSYGKCNEIIAKQKYLRQGPGHIHDISFVVNPKYPFLGASPDGMVCGNGITGIIEIRCPYSIRDMTIADAISENMKCCLEIVEGKYHLKQAHEYWYQVQGQLLVTGAPFCDFMVYTRKYFIVERIRPHVQTMEEIFTFLRKKYASHVKPYNESYIHSAE